MIRRQIEDVVKELSKTFRSITILGPRQTGKTTLAKKCFVNYDYFNFENPDTRSLALSDPRSFFNRISDGAILDEIQRAPDLLSYAQEYLDNSKKNGLYIFTGSNQTDVHKEITQSLAGRTAILRLLPLSVEELKSSEPIPDTDKLLYTGLYPGIIAGKQNPTIAYRSYFETYIEKDLRKLIQVKDIRLFQKFIRLCAGRIGQLFNASNFANETGVSVPTIQHWTSVLEASNIIFLLEPFYINISKRLVKTPKIYFTDTGFASYLLGIENEIQLSRDPVRGFLFENLVILELLKYKYNNGYNSNIFFYRDSHQNEADCLIKTEYGFTAFEIKSSETFHINFYKGLDYLKKTLPEVINKTCVVYSGQAESISDSGHSLINYRNLTEYIRIK